MKNKFLTECITAFFLGASLAFVFLVAPGCATAPVAASSGNTVEARAEMAALMAQTVVTATVPAILNRNPAYEVKLLALCDGVDLVFAKGTLSAEDINVYLDALHFDPDSRLILGSALLDLYSVYTRSVGVKIAHVSDPRFATYLNAFTEAVREGIHRYHVFKPNQARAVAPVTFEPAVTLGSQMLAK